MRKIKCVFKFDDNHKVTREPNDETKWVLDGEGVATRKWDGTACAVIDGKLYARYDCKPTKNAQRKHKQGNSWQPEDFKSPPENAVACQEPDLTTGHWPHWVPVGDKPQYKWIRKALEEYNKVCNYVKDGTYEAVGPKIGSNHEDLTYHILVPHGKHIVNNVPRDFDGMRDFIENFPAEGLVFHHSDGRMAKIKRRDFGFDWPIKS